MAADDKRAEYQPSENARELLANETTENLMMGFARAVSAMDSAQSGARAIIWELRRRSAGGDPAFDQAVRKVFTGIFDAVDDSIGGRSEREGKDGQ